MPDRVAKDIMIPFSEYAKVHESDSLKHTLGIIKESLSSGHQTLAVVDDNDNLVGFLTPRTLLKAFGVYGISDDVWNRITWGIFFSGIERERVKTVKVGRVMRPVLEIFVNEESPIDEVVKALLKHQLNHIPVINKEKRVTGIIRTVDVLDILSDFLGD